MHDTCMLRMVGMMVRMKKIMTMLMDMGKRTIFTVCAFVAIVVGMKILVMFLIGILIMVVAMRVRVIILMVMMTCIIAVGMACLTVNALIFFTMCVPAVITMRICMFIA
jgi:hypothetical protein